MIRKPHLSLIAGHAIRHSVRGGAGLVSLLLTLVVGLSLASVVILPLEEADRLATQMELSEAERAEVTEKVNVMVIERTSKAIDWAMDASPDQLDYLTREHPSTISAILVLLLLVTPLLCCLSGFNQTSGDIGSRGLRYLLLRTERSNIFIGRFIGTYLYTAAVFAALFLILAIYMAIKLDVHSVGEMTTWLAQGYVRLLFFALPYIAICAWVSAAIDSPFGSLVITQLVVYVYPLFVGMASKLQPGAKYLQYLTPWGWKYWLLGPPGPQLFGGIAIMLAFTAGFLFLGYRHFTTRDL